MLLFHDGRAHTEVPKPKPRAKEETKKVEHKSRAARKIDADKIIDDDSLEHYALRDRQVAKMLHVTEQTLRRWRMQGKGPKYARLGGNRGAARVVYKLSDVKAWIEEQLRQSTAEGA